MMTLNDGRSELWQCDTGRTLAVDADCSQVHFSNKVFGRSLDVDVIDGVAAIPDILLQTDKELTAWAFVGTAENGYTKISKVFRVNKRNKPADYVFTEPDQKTLGEILNRIEDLEKRPSGDVSKEDIQDAVNEYLDNNHVSVNETDPTVPDWAKQPEPPKTEVPGTLPNPHKLTFTGAVQAEYDGSKEVTVEIPEVGSGGIPIPETAEVGQSIVVKAVDENGKPTEWEAVDMAGGGLKLAAKITTTENVASISITGLSLRLPVSIRVNCPGTIENTGNGMCLTLNGIRKNAYAGTQYMNVSKLLCIWLYEADGKTKAVYRPTNNDGFGLVELPTWDFVPETIDSIELTSAYNDGTSKYYVSGTVVEVYEGVHPNV